MNFLKTFAIAFTLFISLDAVWLGLIARSFYAEKIGYLMKSQINWGAAFLFYVIFIVSLIIFVISPALSEGSWKKALSLGALFGFVTYATYDLTNLATIRDWPLSVTAIDLMWGSALCATISVGTYFLVQKLGLGTL